MPSVSCDHTRFGEEFLENIIIAKIGSLCKLKIDRIPNLITYFQVSIEHKFSIRYPIMMTWLFLLHFVRIIKY